MLHSVILYNLLQDSTLGKKIYQKSLFFAQPVCRLPRSAVFVLRTCSLCGLPWVPLPLCNGTLRHLVLKTTLKVYSTLATLFCITL